MYDVCMIYVSTTAKGPHPMEGEQSSSRCFTFKWQRIKNRIHTDSFGFWPFSSNNSSFHMRKNMLFKGENIGGCIVVTAEFRRRS